MQQLSFTQTRSRMFCLLACFLLMAGNAIAQPVITVPYPAPAQNLTQSLNKSLLTVQVAFPVACSGNTVRISFPPSVTYVAGSITKTSGSGPVMTITESDISNLNAPVFALNGVTGAGDITFTVLREMACSSSGSGKDTIRISGSCGSAIENASGINTYNLLAPALSLSTPAAITGALIGNSYTRDFSVTNGGNGCLDTLWLSVVRPVATFTATTLAAGAVNLTAYRINGDTSFYKIAAALLPGGDNLMCNGETILFHEGFTLGSCTALNTTYMAGWGKKVNTLCQQATGTGTVTTAIGVANISATFTRVRNLNWCQPGSFTIRYTNNGNGGNAGAAYSILARLGYNVVGNATDPSGFSAYMPGRIDSVKIGTVTVPVIAATSSAPLQADFNGLTADPDGAGTGLEDLDNDGRFDDLAPGQSITITVYEHWIDNSAGCPTPAYGFFTSHTLSYKNMCGSTMTTNPLSAGGAYRVQTNNGGNITVPAEISSGVPFTIQACINQSSYSPPGSRSKDSLFLDVVLPAGLKLSATPNVKYNGVAAAYYIDTIAGIRTLHVGRKGKSTSFCYSFDLVYDCSGGSPVSPQINIWYQGDSCSQSIERHMCKTASIKVSCAAPCADGILNYLPFVNRLSLGYTDATLSTRVSASSVTGLAKYTAVPLDTIQIIVPGKQSALLGIFNNLYYSLQFGKAGSADVFQFLSGTFNQVTLSGSSSTALAAPLTTGSTTAIQKLRWDLSSNLNAGVISSGDSVWLDLRFVVSRANNDLLYGSTLTQVPNTSSSLYNVNLAGNPVGCDTAHAVNLLVTGNTVSNYTPAITVSNCNVTTTGSNSYHGNASGADIFPTEYRPQSIIDSVLITLPAGYILSPLTTNFTTSYWGSLTGYSSYPAASSGVIAQRSATSWVVKNPNLASGGWQLSDMGNSSFGCYALSYNIAPTCASVIGTQSYNVRWYYRDFVYTGNTAAYASKTYAVNAAVTYNATVIPALTLQNNTGVVQGVLPQHYWDVQLNSTGTGAPPYVWMALDRNGSSISIDSVVYEGSNITAGGTAYGTGKTWYRLSSGGIPSGASRKARIYFKYANCATDSIKVMAGWNCTDYPSPDPTANNCTEIAQYLKVIPQASQVQLSVLRQPGNGSRISLCTTDSILVTVNSAQSANLVDPYIDIIAPTGITISNPVMVEFPAGSGNYQPLPATVVSGAYRVLLSGHTAIGANGIPGSTVNPGTAGRQATIKVYYTTDCGIISGYPVAFQGYGKRPCGSVAQGNGTSLSTAGVQVQGAGTTGAVGLSVKVPVASMNCGNTVPVSMVTIPVITPTQYGDTVICTLPRGMVYAGGFSGGYNCASCNMVAVAGPSGTTLLKVSLQQGVAAGDSLKYNFLVAPAGEGCGSVTISANAVRNISGLMCGTTVCTGSKAVIGNAISPTITMQKPELVVTNMNIDSAHWVAGQYQHIYLYYRNNGTQAYMANTDTVEFFCGAATTPFAARALGKSLAPGSADSQAYWVFIPKTACTTGDLVTAKIRTVTASGNTQCLCAASSYQLSGVSLPLSFLSSNATQKDCGVQLDWTYNTDDNQPAAFAVERMTGGQFEQIGLVSDNRTQYTDMHPLQGMNYYRIKATEVSGKATYSNTLKIAVTDCDNTITVYPNPAQDELFIAGAAPGAVYELLNTMGQVVAQGVLKGNGRDNIMVNTLHPGVYQLRLQSNGLMISRQITIVHQ